MPKHQKPHRNKYAGKVKKRGKCQNPVGYEDHFEHSKQRAANYYQHRMTKKKTSKIVTPK